MLNVVIVVQITVLIVRRAMCLAHQNKKTNYGYFYHGNKNQRYDNDKKFLQ